jgi:hypothetical protein
MARGWESKSVEDQQADFSRKPDKAKGPISPADRAKESERERLQLARVNVANQLQAAQNPKYIELLKNELAELDRQIAEHS